MHDGLVLMRIHYENNAMKYHPIVFRRNKALASQTRRVASIALDMPTSNPIWDRRL